MTSTRYPDIPLVAPEITEDDRAAVMAVLRTRQLSRGPEAERFERRVARAVGRRHAVAVSSGTSGLQLAAHALGLGADDEVVTTPYSFVASASSLLYAGSRPVFVDVNAETLQMDADAASAAVTSRTRAILPVHVYGVPFDADALDAVARQHALPVLEDACEALGTEWQGRAAGSIGEASVLSFYPNKQVITGEGGVVTTDDEQLAEHLRRLRNQGRVASADGLDQQELGYSCRLPEMSCALGASQMRRLSDLVARRQTVAAAYRERLETVEEITLLQPPTDARISWFAFPVLLADGFDAGDREAVRGHLAAEGIACERYFAPIHLQPLFRRRFGFRPGQFPVAESAAARVLIPPFFPRLTESQIDRVCEELVRAVRRRARARAATVAVRAAGTALPSG